MNKTVFVALISAFLLSGCAIGFGGPHRHSLVIVPALPETVELDADQYYVQNGYYYRYQGNVWVYSSSRQGPWSQLPRNHYPKQIRYRDQGNHGNDNHDNDRRDNDDRDHDKR